MPARYDSDQSPKLGAATGQESTEAGHVTHSRFGQAGPPEVFSSTSEESTFKQKSMCAKASYCIIQKKDPGRKGGYNRKKVENVLDSVVRSFVLILS